MKRFIACGFLCIAAVLALAPSASADLGPAWCIVIPEAIWAPATGGGTWATALQLTAKLSGTTIFAGFFYGSDFHSVMLTTSTADHQTFRYPNVLEAMQTIDPSFDYYGRVGALRLFTFDREPIWAQAMTTNGNYGKTMPAFDYFATANSANVGREMVISGVMNDPTYRFFVGAYNTCDTLLTVHFHIMAGNTSMGYVERTIPSLGFVAFNPFAELGITDPCSNHWLHICPVNNYGGTAGGLICFGSMANNVTNDTSSLIAIPFQ